jgi:hypothetical protein
MDSLSRAAARDWKQAGNTVERDDNSVDRPSGMPPKLYRCEPQGPTAASIVAKLTGGTPPDVKFFNMTEFAIAGAKAYSTSNLESGWIPTAVPAIFGPELRGYRSALVAVIRRQSPPGSGRRPHRRSAPLLTR